MLKLLQERKDGNYIVRSRSMKRKRSNGGKNHVVTNSGDNNLLVIDDGENNIVVTDS